MYLFSSFLCCPAWTCALLSWDGFWDCAKNMMSSLSCSASHCGVNGGVHKTCLACCTLWKACVLKVQCRGMFALCTEAALWNMTGVLPVKETSAGSEAQDQQQNGLPLHNHCAGLDFKSCKVRAASYVTCRKARLCTSWHTATRSWAKQPYVSLHEFVSLQILCKQISPVSPALQHTQAT